MDILNEIYRFIISNDGLNNIAASIVSAFITYIILAIFHIRLPLFSNYLFWKSFSKDLVVVISEVPIDYDPLVRIGTQPQLTPICDAMVLADFLNFLRSECKSNPQIVSVNGKADFDIIKDHNLLIIGGPKYNIAAFEFLKEIDKELIYQFRRIREPEPTTPIDPNLKCFASSSNDYYNIQCRSDDEFDYGMVVLRKSPYISGKHVLVVGGLSTLATLAAANWLRTRKFYFWLNSQRKYPGFQAVIKCRSIDRVKVSNIETLFDNIITVKD